LRAGLGGERRLAVLNVLRRKVAVLAKGARKRGKLREAEGYETILTECMANEDGGNGNTHIRDGQGLSPADR
jgi:hypothetical protein